MEDRSAYYYLFPRTNREKEIWFNKLDVAVRMAKGQVAKTPDRLFRIFMNNMYRVSANASNSLQHNNPL